MVKGKSSATGGRKLWAHMYLQVPIPLTAPANIGPSVLQSQGLTRGHGGQRVKYATRLAPQRIRSNDPELTLRSEWTQWMAV